jgi:fatty-acyl-CoA synthase
VIPNVTGHSIAGTLAMAAATSRGIRAIEHDGRVVDMPYEWLLEESLRIAGALRAEGLATGDRVAIVVPEVGGFIRAFFGVSAAGLVPVPLCPPAQAGDIATFTRQSRELLAASRVAAVVVSADIVPLLSNKEGPSRPVATCHVLTIEELANGPAMAAPVAVPSSAAALIQFTSGSTAVPKGVVLSHAGLHANLSAITGPAGLAAGPADVGVSWLPLYHDMGLIGALLAGVYARLSLVIMSPVLFLKRPTVWLESISRYGGTISFAPNFAYELCLRRVKPSQIAALDLSRWRVAGCGAEPIRCDTLAAFAERFACAGFRASSFVPSYGLAEHSLAVAFARDGISVDSVDAGHLVRDSRAIPIAPMNLVKPANPVNLLPLNGHTAPTAPVRLVACGRPFPGHEVRIVDDDGQALPERYVGHIVARGPSVMSGYFEDPVATAEALHDGWLQTGDLGYMADGELFVCGRTKDLIIRHGRKYHPPDLESAIASVDGIRSSGVVVFGINHVEDADEVVAVLEARASSTSSDIVEDVRRRVRETAGLELDQVILTPPGTIPRTTSGKVRRSETRARFQAGTLLTAGRGSVADGSAR